MTRMIVRALHRVAMPLLLAVVAIHAVAQEKFPARPMEMIVPWGPGGGADLIGRLVARWFESDLPAQIPVLNQPGAVGTIGLAKLLQSPPDGHAIGVMTSDTLMAMELTPGKPVRMSNLMPLAVLTRQPSGLFVRADSRFKSWADVVTEARAKPDAVTVGTTGPGSPDDMSIAVLRSAGVAMTAVAFTRPAERYTAVLGGHVDLLFEQAGDIKAHLDAKSLRPLLFFSAQRLPPPFDGVPTAGELGIDFTVPQLRMLVVRADTDPRSLAQLAASLERFAASPGYVAFLRDQLALPDSFGGTAVAQSLMDGDIVTMKRLGGKLAATAK